MRPLSKNQRTNRWDNSTSVFSLTPFKNQTGLQYHQGLEIKQNPEFLMESAALPRFSLKILGFVLYVIPSIGFLQTASI